jgi:hypothetical protein
MYWYMKTKVGSRALLSDETWARIPRTHADRRAVGAALLVLGLLLVLLIVGNNTGVLVPRLSYEAGSMTPNDARPHTITVRATIHNQSARDWKITGATINAPGTVHDIRTTPVKIPAHETRTILVGDVHVDNCAAILPAVRDQANPSYAIKLRVERLLGVSTVAIPGLDDDQLRIAACSN